MDAQTLPLCLGQGSYPFGRGVIRMAHCDAAWLGSEVAASGCSRSGPILWSPGVRVTELPLRSACRELLAVQAREGDELSRAPSKQPGSASKPEG